MTTLTQIIGSEKGKEGRDSPSNNPVELAAEVTKYLVEQDRQNKLKAKLNENNAKLTPVIQAENNSTTSLDSNVSPIVADDNLIHIPSLDLYFATKIYCQGLSNSESHWKLLEDNFRMPTLYEFIHFFDFVMSPDIYPDNSFDVAQNICASLIKAPRAFWLNENYIPSGNTWIVHRKYANFDPLDKRIFLFKNTNNLHFPENGKYPLNKNNFDNNGLPIVKSQLGHQASHQIFFNSPSQSRNENYALFKIKDRLGYELDWGDDIKYAESGVYPILMQKNKSQNHQPPKQT